MAVKMAINGFGRIGRQVLKALLDNYPEEIEVVAVHDLVGVAELRHLFSYDSNYGKFPGKVKVDGDNLVIAWTSDAGTRHMR